MGRGGQRGGSNRGGSTGRGGKRPYQSPQQNQSKKRQQTAPNEFRPPKNLVNRQIEHVDQLPGYDNLSMQEQINAIAQKQNVIIDQQRANGVRIGANSKALRALNIRITGAPVIEHDKTLEEIWETMVKDCLLIPDRELKGNNRFGVRRISRTNQGKTIIIECLNEYTKGVIFGHTKNLGKNHYQGKHLSVKPDLTPEDVERETKALMLRRQLKDLGVTENIKVVRVDQFVIGTADRITFEDAQLMRNRLRAEIAHDPEQDQTQAVRADANDIDNI